MKNKLIYLFVILLAIVGAFAANRVIASTVSIDIHDNCGRHGFQDRKTCGFNNHYYGVPGQSYIAFDAVIDFSGHRHGSSEVDSTFCLITVSGGVAGPCYRFHRFGDGLGYEYGDEHPQNYYETGQVRINNPGQEYFVTTTMTVEDSEIWLDGVANAYIADPPPPPPPQGTMIVDVEVYNTPSGQPTPTPCWRINGEFGDVWNRCGDASFNLDQQTVTLAQYDNLSCYDFLQLTPNQNQQDVLWNSTRSWLLQYGYNASKSGCSGNGNPTPPPPPGPTPPPPPPSVTAALRFNGQKGPITVPSGTNVTVTWTSTGAYDCWVEYKKMDGSTTRLANAKSGTYNTGALTLANSPDQFWMNCWSDPALTVQAGDYSLIYVDPAPGSIIVQSNNNLSNWTINGPSTFSGQGSAPAPGFSAPAGTYTMSAQSLGGYDLVVTPSSGNLPSGGTLTFNLNYTLQTGDVRINASISQGSWTFVNNTTGIQYNSGSNSGTTPLLYTVPAGTYTLTANPVAGYSNSAPNPQTVSVGGHSSQDITLLYNIQPLNPPTISSVNNSTCGRLVISWNDTNTIEGGYRVYRRDASGGGQVLIKTLAPDSTSYTDPSSNIAGTNPIQDHSYYYMVQAFTDVPIPGRTANSAEFGPILNILCRPNLNVTKAVNALIRGPFPPGASSTYSSATTIQDTDVLRFLITIANYGNVAGAVTSVNDVFSMSGSPAVSNFTQPPSGLPAFAGCASPAGPWNLCIDRDGDGIYNELSTAFGSEVGSVSGTIPNLTINVSGGWGSKDVSDSSHPNWVIKMDAQVKAGTADLLEQVSNRLCADYGYSGNSYTSCGQFGPILVRVGENRIPKFREVNP